MDFHELTHQQQLDVVIDLHQQCDHLERENAKQAELLNKVIEQRDELLAALEKICEADSDIGMWSIASDALTKAKDLK